MSIRRFLYFMILIFCLGQTSIFSKDKVDVINASGVDGIISSTTEDDSGNEKPDSQETTEDDIPDYILPDIPDEITETPETPELPDFPGITATPTDGETSEDDVSDEPTEEDEYVPKVKENKDSSPIIMVGIVIIILLLIIVIILLIRRNDNVSVSKGNNIDEEDKDSFSGTSINISLEMIEGQLKKGSASYVLNNALTMGSATSNDIVFVDSDVEQSHAKLINQNGEIYIVDTSNQAGTYIYGMRIQEQNVICSGDVVSMGNAEFKILF